MQVWEKGIVRAASASVGETHTFPNSLSLPFEKSSGGTGCGEAKAGSSTTLFMGELRPHPFSRFMLSAGCLLFTVGLPPLNL